MDYSKLLKDVEESEDRDTDSINKINSAEVVIAHRQRALSVEVAHRIFLTTEAFLDFRFSDLWSDGFSYNFFLMDNSLFGINGYRSKKHKMEVCRNFGSYIRSFFIEDFRSRGENILATFFITIGEVDSLDEDTIALTTTAMQKIAESANKNGADVVFHISQKPLNTTGLMVVEPINGEWIATKSDVQGDEKSDSKHLSAASVFKEIMETY